jgi:hypothetical protein
MSKLLALLIGFGTPLVIWLLVFVATRMRFFDMTSMSRVLSAWRLICLVAALPFLSGSSQCISCAHFYWCFLDIALILALPQAWLTMQIQRAEQVGAQSQSVPCAR